MRQIREVQTWKQVRRAAGAVMCETRDLGDKKPVTRIEACVPKGRDSHPLSESQWNRGHFSVKILWEGVRKAQQLE